jgi:hypothetical protein
VGAPNDGCRDGAIVREGDPVGDNEGNTEGVEICMGDNVGLRVGKSVGGEDGVMVG